MNHKNRVPEYKFYEAQQNDQLIDISINQEDVLNILVDHLKTELMREVC